MSPGGLGGFQTTTKYNIWIRSEETKLQFSWLLVQNESHLDSLHTASTSAYSADLSPPISSHTHHLLDKDTDLRDVRAPKGMSESPWAEELTRSTSDQALFLHGGKEHNSHPCLSLGLFCKIHEHIGQLLFILILNMHAKSLQSYPTLCNPMDYSPPGSSVHGIPKQEYLSGLPHPPLGESSPPKDQNHVSCVSCIGRQILYHWATREALFILTCPQIVRRPSHLTCSGSSFCFVFFYACLFEKINQFFEVVMFFIEV